MLPVDNVPSPVSFRARLTLVFLSIVGLLLVVVGVALFVLIGSSERAKADADTAAGQRVVAGLYRDEAERAAGAALAVGRDEVLAAALRAGARDRAVARAQALLVTSGRGGSATRIRITDRGGAVIADVGDRTSVAPVTRELQARPGIAFGGLQVAVQTAAGFAIEVQQLTGLDVVVRAGERTLARTLTAVPEGSLPADATIEAGDEEYRVATTEQARGFGGAPVQVSVLDDRDRAASARTENRILAGGVLLGFLLLAVVGAAWVSRAVQRQIAAFLDVARRISRGDFGATVPVAGRDEFAALGREFNHLAVELEGRLAELARQRARLQQTVRRVGEAFASNLDRPGLLALIASTTVDGVGADGGRVHAGGESSGYGEQAGGLEAHVRAAEAHVLEHGEPHERREPGGTVIAMPLRGQARDAVVGGIVTVWRRGRPFLPAERELLTYLASQGGVSLENVALHETVQRQALTDELTGLANHRAFQETLSSEVERARRFGQSVGLVLVDLDDFKLVNDRYGHQVGDRVLQEVARCLRESSREVDAPARYGGEELALVLPGTDAEGAHELADRVRTAIAALEVPLGAGHAPVRVTASLGVAALPDSALDQRALIAAADAALYEAKRSGKDRTVRAGTLRAHGTAR